MMIEKLLVHLVASGLTQAAMSGATDANPAPDPELSDPETKGRVAEAWEIHRSYYHGVVKTLANDDWPTPRLQLQGLLASITDAIGPALAGQGPLGAVLGPLVSALVGRLVSPTPATGSAPPDPSQLK